MIFPQRMEIWYADLPIASDSNIQGGFFRPVLIISNDVANAIL